MRWSLKDVAASILVAAVVAPYLGYLARGQVPFVEDVPSMAGAGIILGLAAFVIGVRPREYGTGPYLPSLAVGGLVTLALGVAAYTTENSGVLMAFMTMIVMLWLVTSVHHVRSSASRPQRVAHLSGEVVIQRPLEEVFDFVADEENEPKYNERMVRAEKLTEGPVGCGTRFAADTHMFGFPLDMIIELTEFDRPRRLGSVTHMADSDIDGVVVFESIPEGTRLRWSWTATPKGVASLFSPVVAKVGDRQESARWTNLKSLLEAHAVPRSTP